MKSKLCLDFKNGLLCFWLFTLMFTACKKDYTPLKSEALTTSNMSNLYSTDGTLAVQLSILPPTTPPSFIANGGTSTVQYQLTSATNLLDVSAHFNATYPAIEYVNFNGIAYNHGGNFGIDPFAAFPSSGSTTVTGEKHYRPVDSTTSGTIAQVKLNWLGYLTYNNLSYNFFVGKAGEAPNMCLVNNIPHIMFQNPTDDTLKNGYSEIAQIKLTGDTNWVLNALPLNLYSWDVVTIPHSKLIVRCNNSKIATTSRAIELLPYSNSQTVLHFTGGFKHEAGNAEILKVYANVPPGYHDLVHMSTTMQPLKSFVWTDGLGKLIAGSLNAKYYKEQTGGAVY